MKVPEQLAVEDAAMAMDGGSIFLGLKTDLGEQHRVLLAQHQIPTTPDAKHLRGRLYFDGELVSRRSDTEQQILAALRRAPIIVPTEPTGQRQTGPGAVVGEDIQAFLDKVAKGPTAATAHLVAELIRFVESEEYLTFDS